MYYDTKISWRDYISFIGLPLVCLALLGFSGCSKEHKITRTKTNRDGTIEKYEVKADKNGKPVLDEEGKEIKNGKYVSYFDDGVTKSFEGEYLEGKWEGKWVRYYETGNMEWEGYFDHGKRRGVWKYYDENQLLTREERWVGGSKVVPKSEAKKKEAEKKKAEEETDEEMPE